MSAAGGRKKAMKAAPLPAQRQAQREAILAAAADVYARQGFHRTSVEQILHRAKVSRPTFYRHFRDRTEVIDAVLRSANDSLRRDVAHAVLNEADAVSMLRAGVDAYFEWCESIGALVGPMYSEINDPDSPASRYRDTTIGAVVGLLHTQSRLIGDPEIDPLLYDSLLRAVEHVTSGAFWPTKQPREEIERRRRIAHRILLAGLATPETVADIPPLPKAPAAAGEA